MTLARRVRKRLLVLLAVNAGYAILRILSWTWRTRIEPGPYLETVARREKIVAVFWHNRILPFTVAFTGYHALISTHSDGEIIARLAERFGHIPVRGSSRRGKLGGLRGLIEAAKAAGGVVVTADGPRPPRYRAAAGPVEVALASGRRLFLATWAADRAWRLPSWDGFLIPKPFARILFRIEPFREIEAGLDAAGRERVRAELESTLRRGSAEIEDAVLGAHDPLLDGETARLATGAAVPQGGGPRPGAYLAAALATCAALLGLERLVRGGDPAVPRVDLCALLLLASAIAPILGAALSVARLRSALIGTAIGTPLAAALAGGWGLLGKALLGSSLPVLLGAFAAALARALGRTPRALLLAALPPLALDACLFVAAPFLGLMTDPGEALAVLLRISPATAVSGSLLGIDILRAAPLYGAFGATSDAPFAYPPFATSLAAPAAGVLLSLAIPLLRRGLARRVEFDNAASRA